MKHPDESSRSITIRRFITLVLFLGMCVAESGDSGRRRADGSTGAGPRKTGCRLRRSMVSLGLMKRKTWVRIGTFALLVAAGLALYQWFNHAYGPINWREVFASRENLMAFVEQFDPYGPLVFFVIQTVQVVVAPIPGNVTAMAAGTLFGLWEGFLVSTAGLIVGSVIAFGIARIYGRPLVERLVKPSVVDKYIDAMANRHFVLLFLVFLFPFFPDDALCLIAGISALPLRVFLLLVIVGRPPGMFVSNLVGSGVAVIPWWGWLIIAAVSALVLFFAYRYKDVLDAKLGVKPRRRAKKKTAAP